MIPVEFGKLVLWRNYIEQEHPTARIVATNGCFDVLHRGHLSYLEYAKSSGDILVVGINSDWGVRELKGPSRPINKQDDRRDMLKALRCVDAAFIFDGCKSDVFLNYARPHVYVKAADYSLDTLNKDEYAVLSKMGTKIVFAPLVDGLSTTGILNKLKK